MPIPAPLYYDWQFWSAIAAVIALVLSQLPPLHILFKRAKLNCEAFNMLHLTHRIGNPQAQWHLIIENTGGRTLRIKQIKLAFSKDEKNCFELSVRGYLKNPDSKDAVLFTPFRLRPGEEWSHIVNFFNYWNRTEEKEVRHLESVIRTSILEQKILPENTEKLCTAKPEDIIKLTGFFERHFQWRAGEWAMELSIITDQGINIFRKYSFTLFESESQELFDYSERYKYGAGVCWDDSQYQKGLIISIHEK